MAGWPLSAKDGPKGAKGSSGQESSAKLTVNARPVPAAKVAAETQASHDGKEPWLGVKVVIADDERNLLTALEIQG